MPKKNFRAEFKIPKQAAMGCDEVTVVGSGDLTYVWIGNKGQHVANFSGPALLRKLAKAIEESLATGKRRRAG